MTDARVAWLRVGGPAEPWRRIGLHVDADGAVPFLATSLRLGGPGAGIVGWALSGVDPSVTSIDGLPTEVVDPPAPVLVDHPNGALELDHVVILTSSLERTSDAIAAATGEPLKRVREVGAMRQGFHRIGRGGLVVEVVERPEVDAPTATFWGTVLNVADLDAAVALCGPDLIGTARDAVQPGRRIATVREAAGLGVPVALMSPDRR